MTPMPLRNPGKPTSVSFMPTTRPVHAVHYRSVATLGVASV